MNDAAVAWLESVAYRQTVAGTSNTPEGFFGIKPDNELHTTLGKHCWICFPPDKSRLSFYPGILAQQGAFSFLRNPA
jgi:hypothetical protein